MGTESSFSDACKLQLPLISCPDEGKGKGLVPCISLEVKPLTLPKRSLAT